ncbi:MAG: heavy-metal-associated domain-containing protein [Kiritimatiellae bacterium]|nr:heavy-metal-associated domain-containing protein [Kiritimatiellia bacterium]
MRVLRVVAGLVLLSLLGASCRTQDVRETVVHVPGAKSEEDYRKIRETLSAVEGIHDVRVDTARRLVIVKYDSMRLALKNIEFEIAELGYAANNTPARPAQTPAAP